MEPAQTVEELLNGRLFTTGEVAAQLRVGEGAVRDWLQAGQLRGIRFRSSRLGWRIRESDLIAFIKSQLSGSDPTPPAVP